MSPITHFLASWSIAQPAVHSRRERAWITFAGVAPDLDGLGVVVDLANRVVGRPDSTWFATLHHILFHGALGAALVVTLAVLFGIQRPRTLILILVAFHLHLLCDLVGSRGPSPGEIWPIDYLSPFSHSWSISWSNQWALNAWPNIAFTVLLLLWSIAWAIRDGFSPVSVFSLRADAAVVLALRRRWLQRSQGSSIRDRKN